MWEVVAEGKEDCSANYSRNIFQLLFIFLMLENGIWEETFLTLRLVHVKAKEPVCHLSIPSHPLGNLNFNQKAAFSFRS